MLRRVLLAFSLVFGIALQANAQSNKVALFEAKHPTAKVRLDKKGNLTSIRHRNAPVYQGSAAEAATAYLREVSEVFDGESFGAPIVREVAGRTIVTFPQVLGGVSVVGRGVTITLESNQPRLLSRASHPLAARSQAELTADFDATIAVVLANEAVQHSDAAESHAQLVLLPVGSQAVLAYSVLTQEGLSVWRVFLDAKTGGLLWKQDQMLNVKAKVFPDNPGFDGTTALIEVDLPALRNTPDAEEGILGDFVQALSCTAPFTDPRFGCTPQGVALPDVNGDLLFDPLFSPTAPGFDEDAFSQVHMFFHVDRIHSFFQALGATDEIGQITFANGNSTNLDAPLLAVTDLHFAAGNNGDFDNAFFSGTSIIFGNGSTRDFSYDADVIYHEYGHAVISFALAGVSFDDLGIDTASGGINEGSADVFSTLFTNDPELGEFIQNSPNGLRNLENNRVYPHGLDGETHDDGEIWGGAFWELKTRFEEDFSDEVGSQEAVRELVAKIYIAAILGSPANDADFGELGLTLIDFAQDLGDDFGIGDAAALLTEEVLTSRGILNAQGQPALRIVPIEPPNVPAGPTCAAFLGSGNFCQFAIGQSRLGVSAETPVPGTLQYSATVPPGQELRADILVTDFNGNSDFELYINEGSPVEFVFDFFPSFDVTVNTQQTLDAPSTITLQNFTDQPKTFFLAVGVLLPDINGFGVIASISNVSLQAVALPPPPLETIFSGGACSVSQDKTPVMVLLLFALAGLYLITLRKRTTR